MHPECKEDYRNWSTEVITVHGPVRDRAYEHQDTGAVHTTDIMWKRMHRLSKRSARNGRKGGVSQGHDSVASGVTAHATPRAGTRTASAAAQLGRPRLQCFAVLQCLLEQQQCVLCKQAPPQHISCHIINLHQSSGLPVTTK